MHCVTNMITWNTVHAGAQISAAWWICILQTAIFPYIEMTQMTHFNPHKTYIPASKNLVHHVCPVLPCSFQGQPHHSPYPLRISQPMAWLPNCKSECKKLFAQRLTRISHTSKFHKWLLCVAQCSLCLMSTHSNAKAVVRLMPLNVSGKNRWNLRSCAE